MMCVQLRVFTCGLDLLLWSRGAGLVQCLCLNPIIHSTVVFMQLRGH